MPNTVPSPNMNMPIPVVSTDPGPDWATNINASLGIVDSHNHSSGQGIPINPDGININTDLPFNGNNGTQLRSARFNSQGAALVGATDLGCVYVVGNELYYNDENGVAVQITSNGSVNSGAGSISGLPSGTASASFSGGTFSWRSATNTPATMSMGPLVTGAQIANPKTVTMSAASSQAANYSVTLPTALPASTALRNCDSSGNESYVPTDNTSFGISGGVYGVLNGGITNSKLANLNYVTGGTAASSTTGVTFQPICSTSTITCIGRPVMVVLTNNPGSGSSISTIETNSLDMIVGLQIVRDFSTTIARSQYQQADTNGIIPAWTVLDIPSSGNHTYTLYANTQGGTVVFIEVGLIAIEL